ncbi:glycosyltransferase family A protein [Vibrio alginolyticus]
MLSIIIPVYNSEETITKCIDSIIAADKSTPEVISEVIAIDDGSLDNSLLLLNKIASRYEKLNVISQENKGAGGARNKGLREAKSKFISFVDSDDYVHVDYLSPLLEASNYSIISFNVLKKSKSKPDSIIFPKGTCGPMVSAFFDKDIFVNHDLFFPENINYEDNAISYLVWELGKDKRVHINKELYTYQYTSSSQSNTKSKHHLSSRIKSMTYMQDKAKNTPLKKSIFYFCIENLGFIGYLLICLKRLNKIYR